MRAMLMHEPGGTEVLVPGELPTPELRENDVLVKVSACSVNPVDTKVRRNPGARPLPIVLGYDVSGQVMRRGSRVTEFAEGDEVFAAPSLFRNGANAEFVAIDARSAARKPKSLDHSSAAALPLVSQTAWEALHLRARIHPGQTILIHAGAGGVGHIAVQLAKLHGCRVLTTASRPESIAFCRDLLRADEVIDYRATNVVEYVRELTHGKGLPVVIDTVGGPVFEQSLDCAGFNGQVVTILGSNTGTRGQQLLVRNVTVHYEFMAVPAWQEIEPERPGQILAGVARLIDAGLLRVVIGHRFPLRSLAAAHAQIESGHTIGKVVVEMPAEPASFP